ncbi:Gfo/Idh/MocA family protein [Sphingorhabdus arenilitoris]|uniref:Gfo/Idh/MocA family protein n=1 Tax=Sphingorhabdus arenilitoris TaxID=1490041 RepID=A0ABV8RGV4_9SPHN
MIKIAQVGCGYWGKNLARNFFEIGNLAAVVDDNPAVAADMAAKFGVEARGFDEILADESIDGIALATPAELHGAQAARIMEAGKHCYVEKPLALSVADAEQLISLARKHDRTLMVGHLLQYHPVFLKCLQMVREGAVGALRYIYSNRMSLGKFRVEENVLWSFAPHDISMILAIAAEEPVAVTAQGMDYVTPGVADWCTAQMSFASGLKAHVQVSWLHPFKEQRLVIIGEKGSLVFEDSQPDWHMKLAFYPHQIQETEISGQSVPIKGELSYEIVPHSEPLKNECQHFVDAIAGKCSPRTSGEEGLAVLRVLAAAEVCLTENILKQKES